MDTCQVVHSSEFYFYFSISREEYLYSLYLYFITIICNLQCLKTICRKSIVKIRAPVKWTFVKTNVFNSTFDASPFSWQFSRLNLVDAVAISS